MSQETPQNGKSGGGWFAVPNRVYDQLGASLGPYGLAVAGYLLRLANRQSGLCFPSAKRIAERTGMSRAQVFRVLAKLEESKLIQRSHRHSSTGNQDANCYDIRVLMGGGADSDGGVTNSDAGSDMGDGGVADRDFRGLPQRHEKDSSKNTHRKTLTHTQRVASEEGFELFLQRHPKPTLGQDARSAWRKANPDGLLTAEILAGLDKWIASEQWQRGVITGPANFLARRLWAQTPTEAKHEHQHRPNSDRRAFRGS